MRYRCANWGSCLLALTSPSVFGNADLGAAPVAPPVEIAVEPVDQGEPDLAEGADEQPARLTAPLPSNLDAEEEELRSGVLPPLGGDPLLAEFIVEEGGQLGVPEPEVSSEEREEVIAIDADLHVIPTRGFAESAARSELVSQGLRLPFDRQGFRLGGGTQVSYDSNVFLLESDVVDDFIGTVFATVDFRSAPEGVPGLVTASYTPYLRLYLQESELTGVDHFFSSSVSNSGTRGEIGLTGNFGQFNRPDRYVGGRSTSRTWSGSAVVSYQPGARTSLEASMRAMYSDESDRERAFAPGVSSQDSLVLTGRLGAWWRLSSRTQIGPTLRYSHSSSGSIGDQSSVALLLGVNYEPRERVRVSAFGGLERLESDRLNGDSEIDFTAGVSSDYRITDKVSVGVDLRYEGIPEGRSDSLRSGGGAQNVVGEVFVSYAPVPVWLFALNAQADAFPSGDSTNYAINDQTYSATITRFLADESSLELSGSLSFSDYDQTGPVNVARDSQEFRELSLRYSRQLVAEEAMLNAAARWSASTGDRDWERVQLSLGVDLRF